MRVFQVLLTTYRQHHQVGYPFWLGKSSARFQAGVPHLYQLVTQRYIGSHQNIGVIAGQLGLRHLALLL